MEILLPRRPESSSWLLSRIFSPSKLISPPTILPGGLAIRRITESAVTLLPQPLSPTTPNVSPGFMVKETSLTALTTPLLVKKYVLRLLTSSKFVAISFLRLLVLGSWVKRVAHAIADKR